MDRSCSPPFHTCAGTAAEVVKMHEGDIIGPKSKGGHWKFRFRGKKSTPRGIPDTVNELLCTPYMRQLLKQLERRKPLRAL